jgi:hypothetical protein
MSPLTRIRDGQKYYDEPVYLHPKPATPIELSLAHAFGRKLPESLLAGHERVKLRWMKPGPDGKLVPR